MDAVTLREFLTLESADGYGYGYGDGDGYGSGDGYGYGYGYGDGYGDGNGYGNGYGYGYGDGNGYGYGYGYGYGNGYGNGDGNGYGNGYGYGSGYGIKSLCGEDVHMVDGVPTIITRVRGNVAKGKIVRGDMGTEAAYIVKGGNCFAHGRTLHEAWAALEDKLFEDMPVEERIDAFAAEFKPGAPRTVADFYAWHHKLTGSCTQGRDAFARDHGLKMDDAMTPEEFIRLTCNAYGGDVIRQLAGRYGVTL